MKKTNPFRFKQFTVVQERAAMKVGTDGVLLGAWTDLSGNPDSILDIGTGTGLIALMLAQRSDAGLIDALEIEPNAYEEAVENFENSEWDDRLFCYHASLEEFIDEMDETYDLIVSNPPFYTDTFKELGTERALARHNASLSYETLLTASAKLLSPNGNASFILPSKEEDRFLKIALENKLHPNRITHVKGHKDAPVKRSLIQMNFTKTTPRSDLLVLETERNKRTEAFRELISDFYLNP